MPQSAFDDQARPPDPSEIAAALGRSAALWERLVSHVADRYPPIHELWHFGGEKQGWTLRVKRGERIVLYLTPQREHFLVGVVLGEKAVRKAREGDLAPEVAALIDQAPKYAEGRGIRLAVATRQDLRAVQALAAAKMAS